METDASFQLYAHYFSCANRVIAIQTLDNQMINGVIIGFIKGDTLTGAPFITQWHVVDETKQYSIGIDPFGCVIGQMVDQTNIKYVKFSDGTTMEL